MTVDNPATSTVDFVPAPILKRIFAFILDLSILSVIMNVLFFFAAIYFVFVFGLSFDDLPQKFSELGFPGILFLVLVFIGTFMLLAIVWHSYFIYFEHKKQRTPGKKIMGLSVISLEGSSLTFKQSVWREIFRSYFDLPFVIPGIVTMLFTKKHQRVGDMMTNTLVVHSSKMEHTEEYTYLNQDDYLRLRGQYAVAALESIESSRYLSLVTPLLMGLSMRQPDRDVAENIFKTYVSPLPEDGIVQDFSLRFFAEYLLQKKKEAK